MKKVISKFLIITIFFAMFIGLDITLIHASTTEIRTTLSRSHYEYWSYNANPDLYAGRAPDGSVEDVRIGDSPTYTFTHTYYRDLNPGERVNLVPRASSQ